MKNTIGSKSFKKWASGQSTQDNAMKALEKRPHMPQEPKLGLPKNKGVIKLLDSKKKLAPFSIWGMHESATRKDQVNHYGYPMTHGHDKTYKDWEADAKKLGYSIHHSATTGSNTSYARQERTTHGKQIKSFSGRGSFTHYSSGGMGYLRYKYMPEAKQPKKLKPYKGQSNVDNQIAALAGQPTGPKSSISTGESV